MTSRVSLAEMRSLNGEQFTDADYIHYVFQAGDVSPDFALALFRFLDPDFEERDGRFLVTANGSLEKYRKFITEGKESSDAQYWANLTNISELFGSLTLVQSKIVANTIAKYWQARLMDKSHDFSQRAYVVEDQAEGEVVVTISSLAR